MTLFCIYLIVFVDAVGCINLQTYFCKILYAIWHMCGMQENGDDEFDRMMDKQLAEDARFACTSTLMFYFVF